MKATEITAANAKEVSTADLLSIRSEFNRANAGSTHREMTVWRTKQINVINKELLRRNAHPAQANDGSKRSRR